MRARRWLFNVSNTFGMVLGGAALSLALMGALGSAWLVAASLVLLSKHMVFHGNNAGILPIAFQPISIPSRHNRRTPAAFSTRRGHRTGLLTGEADPPNSTHTSIRI
jgi:hypothetical protein